MNATAKLRSAGQSHIRRHDIREAILAYPRLRDGRLDARYTLSIAVRQAGITQVRRKGLTRTPPLPPGESGDEHHSKNEQCPA